MVPLFHASAKGQAWFWVAFFFAIILLNRALTPCYRRPSVAGLIGSVIGLAWYFVLAYLQRIKRKFRNPHAQHS